MSTPIIATAGAANGLLKITDHEGTVSRIPLVNVCDIMDSSDTVNSIHRVEICHALGRVILIYANTTEVTAALAAIDALY